MSELERDSTIARCTNLVFGKGRAPSFTEIQERRRSVRAYGPRPIHVDQLGEFLYRSARIKKLVESGGVTHRPSAAGGAIHELEVYPVVASCEGLESGLYHYDPRAHALEKVNANKEATHRMLMLGAVTGVLEQPPHVLLAVAARFQRVQNKYDSVAYSVILKNVGCLYQTMYLVAEAMGLAACAIGGGDSDVFAEATGLDYYAETTVGELLLGSGPDPRPEALAPPKAVMDGRPRWT
jgi:oxazoline/thiazoline dehydrogenase